MCGMRRRDILVTLINASYFHVYSSFAFVSFLQLLTFTSTVLTSLLGIIYPSLWYIDWGVHWQPEAKQAAMYHSLAMNKEQAYRIEDRGRTGRGEARGRIRDRPGRIIVL